MIFKNQQEEGILDEEFYFVNSKGEKTSKINVLEQQDFNEAYTLEKNKNEPSRKQLAVFLGGNGTQSFSDVNKNNFKGNYHFSEIFVDSWDSLRVYNNKKTDSIAETITNNCRLSFNKNK